jgi:ribonuclease HII
MTQAALAHPAYGWAENKGYAAPEHIAALESEGPCALHRRSWRLPGTMVEDEVGEAAGPAPDDHGVLDERDARWA